MDPNIIPIASVVANVLSSLKNARELAKDTSNAELRGQISEAYDALLDLKARLLDMDDDNRRLIAELARRSEIEGPLPPFGYFYKNGDREHPMCPKCFQTKEQRESYLTPATPWNGGIRRECRICGHFIYEKEMDLRPRRTSLRGL